MLDKFVTTPFGQNIAGSCAKRFISGLSPKTKIVVMFGLGNKGNYVTEARKLLERARPGQWRTFNEVSYTDKEIMVVHVEHFASQGALLPNWLGENMHERSKLGVFAREAVQFAMMPTTK